MPAHFILNRQAPPSFWLSGASDSLSLPKRKVTVNNGYLHPSMCEIKGL